jgi:glycosyltransferase involved in cell wall biosynthesis
MSQAEYSPFICGRDNTMSAHTTKRRTVSLIMPAKNEEKSVGPTLDAVFASTRLPDEIIVADGRSVDRTLERVQQYMERGVLIRIVPNPQVFAGAGRNRAAAVASGDILLFLDFGVLVHPRWIEEMTRPFEQDVEVDAVGGLLEPCVESEFEYCVASIQCRAMMLFSRLSRAEQLDRVPAEIRVDAHLGLCGVMAISRTCYQRLGGMPAWLRAAEDKLFGCKMLVARARIVRSLDARCYFHIRKDTRTLFTQHLIYARGDGHIHCPLSYRERRNLLFYLAILVAVGYSAVHPATLPVPLLFFGAYLYRAGVRHVKEVSGGTVRLSHLLQIPRIVIAMDAGTYLGHLIGLFDWITKPHYRQLYQDYMKDTNPALGDGFRIAAASDRFAIPRGVTAHDD